MVPNYPSRWPSVIFNLRLILVPAFPSFSLSLELEGVHVSLTCPHYPILRLGGENPSMNSLH